MKNDLKSTGNHEGLLRRLPPAGQELRFPEKEVRTAGEGKVQYCYECAEFPCRSLKHLDKRYRTNYRMSMIENLNI